jgi:hypothetical protein
MVGGDGGAPRPGSSGNGSGAAAASSAVPAASRVKRSGRAKGSEEEEEEEEKEVVAAPPSAAGPEDVEIEEDDVGGLISARPARDFSDLAEVLDLVGGDGGEQFVSQPPPAKVAQSLGDVGEAVSSDDEAAEDGTAASSTRRTAEDGTARRSPLADQLPEGVRAFVSHFVDRLSGLAAGASKSAASPAAASVHPHCEESVCQRGDIADSTELSQSLHVTLEDVVGDKVVVHSGLA